MNKYELEKDVERYLVKKVKERGGWALKFVSPGIRGVPDRLILLPFGRVAFAELKRGGGELSAWQRKWRSILTGMGFRVGVLWSKADADSFLQAVDSGI